MAGAWEGDFEGRITRFARAAGHDGAWSYLRSRPGVSLVEIARDIGDAAAVQIERMVLAECLERGAMLDLICDLVARRVRSQLPKGWGSGNDFAHSMAFLLTGLPQPYRDLTKRISSDLREASLPPKGWLPASGEDVLLRGACARAVASLPDERRQVVERGGREREPGDLAGAVLAPVQKAVKLGDGEAFARVLAALRPDERYLYAVFWCDAEVCNGGFHQFYANSTGVVAPEATEGFDALGLHECAALVRDTMRFFGARYPRERETRCELLDRVRGDTRKEWDPFFTKNDAYYALFKGDTLAAAADAYVVREGSVPGHR
jgi:hypothetical protein